MLFAPAAPSALPVVVDGTPCHPRRLLVKLPAFGRASDLAGAGYRVVRSLPQIGWAVVETPEGGLAETRGRLRRSPFALRVDLDRAARPAYVPNDPRWSDQDESLRLRLNVAWDRGLGSSAPIVAVLDTGVNAHPDLAANLWANPAETANGVDDDGNGLIDDVRGADFVATDGDPNDVHGHGTACAGLAAARGDNGIGISGAAPRARIMGVKIATDAGWFYDSANVPGALYAADHGARVLSMSYFSDRVSAAEGDAMGYCVAKGVLPVCAAGNDNQVYPYYPAAFPGVLSVAALGTDGGKAGFSNYGAWVDVAAPGTALTTTTASGGYTTGFSGTSGACPMVAGVAALLMGQFPSATAENVRRALTATARPVVHPTAGRVSLWGGIDAASASAFLAGEPGVSRRSPVLRWIGPLGPGADAGAIGVGLDVGRIRASNGLMTDRTDDGFALEGLSGGPLTLSLGRSSLGSFPAFSRLTWPLVDANSPGATDAFRATLSDDKLRLTAPRNGTTIAFAGTFARVDGTGPLSLVLRRRGTGTEKIEVYDWSSASFPYGSWIVLREGAIPESLSTVELPIPVPSKVVDVGRWTLLRITGTSSTPYEIDRVSLVR